MVDTLSIFPIMDAMNPTIRAEMTAEFQRVEALARELFPQYRTARVPRLTFFIKGRNAGVAKLGDWEVSINEYLGAQNREMIFNTISHEIAHIVAFYVYADRGHGAHWKRVHRMLGGTGERCYNAEANNVQPLAGRRTNWYMYRCPNTGIESWIGPKFHSGLQTGKYGSLRNVKHNVRIERSHFTGQSKVKGAG